MADSKEPRKGIFRTHHFPRCSTLVHLQHERCPHCGFDVAGWRRKWLKGMKDAFTTGSGKASKLAGGCRSIASLSALDRAVSSWPDVRARKTKCYMVYSVTNRNFCYIRLSSSMIELFPPLGKIREMIQAEDEAQFIRLRTGKIDVTYSDPEHLLTHRGWNHPAFDYKGRSVYECLYLIKQSYDEVKKYCFK